jgi:hypothetical protein
MEEERMLRLFEETVLKRIFVPKRDEVTEERRKYIMWSVMIRIAHTTLLG